jgi:MerR family redox-sensitive transcriptional activator SoxR
MSKARWIAIGEVAKRTGAAVSAIRFYEEKGLLSARRTEGGNRLFLRSDIRRVSFILIAQRLGFSLEDIGEHLSGLPNGRTPTKKDWAKISRAFEVEINARIAALALMRERLTACIGCGCLSLKACALYNAEDEIAARGPGPRYLMGDKPRRP